MKVITYPPEMLPIADEPADVIVTHDRRGFEMRKPIKITTSGKDPYVGSAQDFERFNAFRLLSLLPQIYEGDWVNWEEVRRRMPCDPMKAMG